MRHAFAFAVFAIATTMTAAAEEAVDLKSLEWVSRPVIVFADSPRDPRFVEQMEGFAARQAELEERDVIVLTDTDPDAKGPLRQKLRPRGFNLVLIGKDGGVKLRTPHPLNVDALNRHIDRMPMRRREIEGGAG